MKQKIEWYREVLELEPGSRVFFPLAKLLSADNQTTEAVSVLRQGVARHPNHVEARLFLVELLYDQGANAELNFEIDGITALFSGYPGFWNAWCAHLAHVPGMQDAALALRFFCAALQGTSVTWASIIEHGLQSVLGAPPAAVSVPAQVVPHTQAETFILPVFTETAQEEPRITEASEGAPASALEAADDEDYAEEAFSLRTRSMADVLAEQGDITGALDIYRELTTSAPADMQAELQTHIDDLTRRLTTPLPLEPAELEAKTTAGAESTRLVSLLESLAQRLEARAR